MNEGFSINSESLKRRNSIEMHAKFDAKTYVNLTKGETSEDLISNETGEIYLDPNYNEAIIGKTIRELNLNDEEFDLYVQIMKEEMISLLRGKRWKIH